MQIEKKRSTGRGILWALGRRAIVAALAATSATGLAADARPGAVVAPAEASVLRELLRQADEILGGNILPFWLKHARDEQRGGFHGLIGADLSIHAQAPRGALLSSRILWTFAAAERERADPRLAAMARWAADDLLTRFWDQEKGGLYWSIKPDGSPLDIRKHIYGQVFGIYALSEYHRATKDAVALDRAVAIYRLLETHARDRTHGGYFEELDRDWRRKEKLDPRARLMGGNAPKSQNAHLHIMESYTNLLRVWPDPQLRTALRELVELMLTRVLNPANHHLRLFLDDDWTPRSDEISYGHDIEFSWLLCETAGVLADEALIARARRVALAIADACLREGVDRDGGMFNEGGPHGLNDANKDWWPQAEAAVGFLNAWQISGDARYLEAARKTWTFIDRCLVSHETGEWYRSADRAGRPDRGSPLASLWKCPYHNSRACLETIVRVRAVLPR